MTMLIAFSPNTVLAIYANDYSPKIQLVANQIHSGNRLSLMTFVIRLTKHYQIFDSHLELVMGQQWFAERLNSKNFNRRCLSPLILLKFQKPYLNKLIPIIKDCSLKCKIHWKFLSWFNFFFYLTYR